MEKRFEEKLGKNGTVSERLKALNVLQAMATAVDDEKMVTLLDTFVAKETMDFLVENLNGLSQGQLVVVAAVINLFLQHISSSFNDELNEKYEEQKKHVAKLFGLASIKVRATLEDMMKKDVDDFLKEIEDEETSKNS